MRAVRDRSAAAASTSSLLATLLAAALLAAPIEAQQAGDGDPALATTVDDGFTIAIVGDIIAAYDLSFMMSEPRFAQVVELIQGADVATGNIEGNIIDGRTLNTLSAGGFAHEPSAADWIKSAGFDLVARPNNHANDFSIQGWAETSRQLDRVGLQYAGVGDTYAAARAARFYTTRRGRAGMVAVYAADDTNISMAEPGRGEWVGRGGISNLQVTRYFMVPESSWGAVRDLRDRFPNGTGFYARGANSDQQITFIGEQFRKAPPGVDEPYYSLEMNQTDLRDILEAVRDGKLKSDFVTFAIHSHHFRDTKGGYRGAGVPETEDLDTNSSIPDFHMELAHAVIDAGADAYQGTGVHALKGIEIYRNRPIYYGLGEFVRQMDVTGISGAGGPARSDCDGCPFPVKFQTIVAVNRYEGGQLAEARLYPVETGYDEVKLARRGIPEMADPETSQQILTRLQALSEPLGTTITIEGNVGVIRP